MYLIKLDIEIKTFEPMKKSALRDTLYESLSKVPEFREVSIYSFESDLPDENEINVSGFTNLLKEIKQESSEASEASSKRQD